MVYSSALDRNRYKAVRELVMRGIEVSTELAGAVWDEMINLKDIPMTNRFGG